MHVASLDAKILSRRDNLRVKPGIPQCGTDAHHAVWLRPVRVNPARAVLATVPVSLRGPAVDILTRQRTRFTSAPTGLATGDLIERAIQGGLEGSPQSL